MFSDYLNSRRPRLMVFISTLFLVIVYQNVVGVSWEVLLVSASLVFLVMSIFHVLEYLRFRSFTQKIDKIMDQLDKRYYAHELLKKSELGEVEKVLDLMAASQQDMVTEIRKLQEKNEEYRELVEELIHEMKTPLTSLQLLQTNKLYAPTASTELKQLEVLLDTCLSYLRLDSLERDYHVRTFSVSDMLHELIMEQKTLLRHKKAQVRVKIPDDREISSDKKWVRFVLRQILSNAAKYVRSGGLIEVFERQDAGMYWLCIRDNGIGISASDLPRVFERGFTGGGKQRKSASGLGLHLAKSCADKMSLGLHIESQKEEYTLVSLGFPR